MALAHTKAEGLALLLQFFLIGMSACQSKFCGHADLLNIYLPLFNSVTRGGFINNSNHLACPSGGISAWTSIQGMGDRGVSVALTLADIRSQDSRLANMDSLSRGGKVTLSVIVGLDNFFCKLGAF